MALPSLLGLAFLSFMSSNKPNTIAAKMRMMQPMQPMRNHATGHPAAADTKGNVLSGMLGSACQGLGVERILSGTHFPIREPGYLRTDVHHDTCTHTHGRTRIRSYTTAGSYKATYAARLHAVNAYRYFPVRRGCVHEVKRARSQCMPVTWTRWP